MAKRIQQYAPAEEGSARWKNSQAHKKRWQDPEYRAMMTQKAKDRWKDPAYVAMIMASKGNPVPHRYIPYLATHYERRAKRLRDEIKKMQKELATLEYQAEICRQGGDPKMLDKVFGDKHSRYRYKPVYPDATDSPDATAPTNDPED